VSEHLGITEELRRLLLRTRWIRWMNRRLRCVRSLEDFNDHMKQACRLSIRLSKIAPTWAERRIAENEYDAGLTI
jgi:hypothetical protein